MKQPEGTIMRPRAMATHPQGPTRSCAGEEDREKESHDCSKDTQSTVWLNT